MTENLRRHLFKGTIWPLTEISYRAPQCQLHEYNRIKTAICLHSARHFMPQNIFFIIIIIWAIHELVSRLQGNNTLNDIYKIYWRSH